MTGLGRVFIPGYQDIGFLRCQEPLRKALTGYADPFCTLALTKK